jgi:hypothetical protein
MLKVFVLIYFVIQGMCPKRKSKVHWCLENPNQLILFIFFVVVFIFVVRISNKGF